MRLHGVVLVFHSARRLFSFSNSELLVQWVWSHSPEEINHRQRLLNTSMQKIQNTSEKLSKIWKGNFRSQTRRAEGAPCPHHTLKRARTMTTTGPVSTWYSSNLCCVCDSSVMKLLLSIQSPCNVRFKNLSASSHDPMSISSFGFLKFEILCCFLDVCHHTLCQSSNLEQVVHMLF